jgi:hypothetical protein
METSVRDGLSETVLRVRSVLRLQVQARDGSALSKYQQLSAVATGAPSVGFGPLAVVESAVRA